MKKIISMVLLLALLASLFGCGGKKEEQSSEETQTEATSAALQWDIDQDPVLREHRDSNNRIRNRRSEDSITNQMDIYISNMQGMAGFISEDYRVGSYQNALQSAFSAASAVMGSDQNVVGHYMAYQNPEDGKSSDRLYWQSEDVSAAFRQDVQRRDFYANNKLPLEGAISQLFDGGTPFHEDGLTMIVSNLEEPGFEFNSLYTGIEKYFDECENSAATIIGISGNFEGDAYIPMNSGGSYESTFYIRDCAGEMPVYFLLVGPEKSVRSYMDTMFQHMDSQNVNYRYAFYSNSRYDMIQAPVLEFTPVEDPKAKKLSEPVFSSFNTGTMTWNEEGTVICTTFTGPETRGQTKRGEVLENGDTAACTQVALFSDNYNDVSEYSVDKTLYILDQDSGTWKDAGKNAASMVEVECVPMNGPVSEEIYGNTVTVLTDGNTEYYIRARLNFDTGSAISRMDTYRLEIRVCLSRKNPAAYGTDTYADMMVFCTTGREYYDSLEVVGRLTEPNRVWTAFMKPTDRRRAEAQISKTPNLEVLLSSLEGLEKKYQQEQIEVEYVDILFNLQDANNKRTTK